MRGIIIGMGVQGRKRYPIAKDKIVFSVDPYCETSDYKNLEDVPLGDFDFALCCVPDDAKCDIIEYLLTNKKHVLVEKPLSFKNPEKILTLEALANKNHVQLYIAYNHRFEPNFVKMRDLISSGTLGDIYHCRLFYGNGTASLVKNSPWRDKGSGVLPDLGSHLLDTINFWFGDIASSFELVSCSRHENSSPDHVIIINKNSRPIVELEMSLLQWKNDFSCDVFAQNGSAHIRSLCKWGPASFISRRRIVPSGVPDEIRQTLVKSDPTWVMEYDHFLESCVLNRPINLDKEVWLAEQLSVLCEATNPIG